MLLPIVLLVRSLTKRVCGNLSGRVDQSRHHKQKMVEDIPGELLHKQKKPSFVFLSGQIFPPKSTTWKKTLLETRFLFPILFAHTSP